LVVLEKLAIAENFFSALRCAGVAAMKNSQVVSGALKGLGCKWSDEAATANENDFHDRRG
jgi:hypothetical protein